MKNSIADSIKMVKLDDGNVQMDYDVMGMNIPVVVPDIKCKHDLATRTVREKLIEMLVEPMKIVEDSGFSLAVYRSNSKHILAREIVDGKPVGIIRRLLLHTGKRDSQWVFLHNSRIYINRPHQQVNDGDIEIKKVETLTRNPSGKVDGFIGSFKVGDEWFDGEFSFIEKIYGRRLHLKRKVEQFMKQR